MRSVLFLSFIAVLFLTSNLAFADEITVKINPAVPGSNPADDPAGIIVNFYQFALMIGGVLAFGAIVYGGIKYVV
ncbi:hypothetical protein C4571_03115, partial [Candidatus Parcubacteria bacterium]